MEYDELDPVTVVLMRLEEARRLERKLVICRCDFLNATPMGDGSTAEVTASLTLSAD